MKYRDSQIFVREAWHVLSYLGVWSLGLFSPTFSPHPQKKKKLIKKEYCRCGPHPPTSDFPQSQTSTCQGSGLHWPPPPRSPGSATSAHGLHCTVGTPKTLHRRLLLALHCTLRPSHLSARGNTRRLEIVGQLDMQEPGLGDYWDQLLTGR